MKKLALTLISCALITSAQAQFSPSMIHNASYWGDGKAEFNIYGAEIMREGAAQPCEVVHILMRDQVDGKPALKLNQILTVPTGLFAHQQMHSSYWRVDDGALLMFCLTSADSSRNVYKEARRDGTQFNYAFRGDAVAQEKIAIPENGYFYDELPWLVRTIDFGKAKELEVQLAGSVINSQKDNFEFKPAKVSFVPKERLIEITVQHAGGQDRFTIDSNFPHLLREWAAADGSHLKLKRNLKVDYWNYNKPGDRERALKNPMLRLPD